MRRGLVVGKFMPLHRGHQLVIETALAQTDELTVVVYDINVNDWEDFDMWNWAKRMPASKRANWITTLYPQIKNVLTMPDALPGDYKDHDDPKYAQRYADQLAFLGPFSSVFTSESYGEPFAEALGAKHVQVDAARNLVPISGTQIRENLYTNRAYVDPLVYGSLIQKVVFVGTESTGKSTLAKKMAEITNTTYTAEYGRTLWEDYQANGVTPRFEDLWHVGRTQYQQEQAALRNANELLFCDTNAWTTMMWSKMYYGTADARLVDLAKRTKDEYIWFLCENDFGWVQDGTRELAGEKSVEFQKANELALGEWGIGYTALYGTLDGRVAKVAKILGVPQYVK
jgi:HTH-type transcriptional regulator, transcriptional repressor of NAD biosynthesis genes